MIGIRLGNGYIHHTVALTVSQWLSVSLKALINSTDSKETVGFVEMTNKEESAGVKIKTC